VLLLKKKLGIDKEIFIHLNQIILKMKIIPMLKHQIGNNSQIQNAKTKAIGLGFAGKSSHLCEENSCLLKIFLSYFRFLNSSSVNKGKMNAHC
jgi:hypothetical protein